MARNVVFIILFVVLYGGIFLLGNYKVGGKLTDRNGFGELTESHYDCDRYSIEMDFKDEWIIVDGLSLKENYTESELIEYYGLPDEFKFLVGITSFNMNAECICYTDYKYDKSAFTDTYLREYLASLDGYAENSQYFLLNAKGSGEKLAVYYYELKGEDGGYFNAYTNAGKNAIYLCGYYNNTSGRDELMDFVKNSLYVNSDASESV